MNKLLIFFAIVAFVNYVEMKVDVDNEELNSLVNDHKENFDSQKVKSIVEDYEAIEGPETVASDFNAESLGDKGLKSIVSDFEAKKEPQIVSSEPFDKSYATEDLKSIIDDFEAKKEPQTIASGVFNPSYETEGLKNIVNEFEAKKEPQTVASDVFDKTYETEGLKNIVNEFEAKKEPQTVASKPFDPSYETEGLKNIVNNFEDKKAAQEVVSNAQQDKDIGKLSSQIQGFEAKSIPSSYLPKPFVKDYGSQNIKAKKEMFERLHKNIVPARRPLEPEELSKAQKIRKYQSHINKLNQARAKSHVANRYYKYNVPKIERAPIFVQ